MQTLSFGDYTFFCDEKSLKLTDEENIKVFSSPISEPKVQSLGKLPRIISGETIYSGERAILQYLTLRALVGSTNTLTTPMGTFNARLFHLTLKGDSNPTTIHFNFKFCEVENES